MKLKAVQKCLLASRTLACSFACRVVRMVIRRGERDSDCMAVSKKYHSNHALPHSFPFRHYLITCLVESSTVPSAILSVSRSYAIRRYLLNYYFLLSTFNFSRS